MASPSRSRGRGRSLRTGLSRRRRQLQAGRRRAGTVKRWVGQGWNWATGEYVCTKCNPHRMMPERGRGDHDSWHRTQEQFGDEARERVENVIAKAEREREQRRKERKPSATVTEERERRRAAHPPPPIPDRAPAPPPPSTRVPQSSPTRNAWQSEIEKRKQNMAGQRQPSSNGQARAVSGPAQGIVVAAQGIVDSDPPDHDNMREMMFAYDAALQIMAEAISAFQERQVQRGFHPSTMVPLDTAIAGLGEARLGFTHTIVAIERYYAPNFEAAQNPGPGEAFFGAKPQGRPAGQPQGQR